MTHFPPPDEERAARECKDGDDDHDEAEDDENYIRVLSLSLRIGAVGRTDGQLVAQKESMSIGHPLDGRTDSHIKCDLESVDAAFIALGERGNWRLPQVVVQKEDEGGRQGGQNESRSSP